MGFTHKFELFFLCVKTKKFHKNNHTSIINFNEFVCFKHKKLIRAQNKLKKSDFYT